MIFAIKYIFSLVVSTVYYEIIWDNKRVSVSAKINHSLITEQKRSISIFGGKKLTLNSNRKIYLQFKWARKSQKVQLSLKQKSWKQINQFHENFVDQNPFFAISKMAKNQFLNWEKV